MGRALRLAGPIYPEELSVYTLGRGALNIHIDDSRGCAAFTLTPEQADELELTLYRCRINRIFENRKEPDADGEPGPGPELEGGTPTPPHP